MNKYFVIIVAAGLGSRMQTNLPKQFLKLGDKLVLMHTMENFYQSSFQPQIIVVLHPGMEEFWKDQCQQYAFQIPHQIAYGGTSRFQSVKNGLDYIHNYHEGLENKIIAIQDAARPLTDHYIIDKTYEEATQGKCVVVARPSADSVRQVDANGQSRALNRNSVYLVQTPQTFKGEILEMAYEQKEITDFTDDASVVQNLGYPIEIVEGNPKNFKITYPEDIQIAELYLSAH